MKGLLECVAQVVRVAWMPLFTFWAGGYFGLHYLVH